MVYRGIKDFLLSNQDKKRCKNLSIVGIMLIVNSSFFAFSCEAAKYQAPMETETSIFNDNRLFSMESEALFSNGDIESSNQWLEKFNFQKGVQKESVTLALSGLNHLVSGDRKQGLDELEQAWEMDPNLKYAGIMIATIHLKEKEFSKALDVAKKLQNTLPKESSGFTLAGIAFIGLKDPKQSKASFEKAIEVNPVDSDARGNLAAYALKEGNIDLARSMYEESLTHNPGHLRIMLRLAKLESNSGHPKKAMFLLEEAMEKHPTSLQVRLVLAWNYLASGNAQKAIDTTEPVLKLYPDEVALLELIGIARRMSGLPAEAVTMLESAVQKSPKAITPYYNLALAYEQLKQYDKAIQNTEIAIKLAPGHAPSQFLHARLKAKIGHLDYALTLLQKLAIAYPGSSEISGLEGRIALAKNQPEKAISLFQEALKSRETNRLTIQLAIAQMRADEAKASYTTLRNWLEKYPLDILTRSTLADFLLGNGLIDEAQEQYLEIVRLQPDIASARNNLAWLLMHKGDVDQALGHAEKAYDLDANNPQVMDTLGNILVRKNQPKKAIELLEKATEISPNDLSMRFHLAQALATINHIDKAKKLLAELLVQNQQFGERQQATELLKKLKEN